MNKTAKLSDDPEERPASRAQIAADKIRAMITDGVLRPGERVNELSIAKVLNMSRGPIREAVGRLATSGLLVEEPNVGARVILPDIKYVQELFQVRELLECRAAFEAATNMTDEELDLMKQSLTRYEVHVRGSGSDGHSNFNFDLDFHSQILRGSRNDLINRICGKDLWDVFLLLRARHGNRSTRWKRAILEHRMIADAIKARNAEVAALLMRQHIQASRKVFLEIMEER